MPSMTNIKQRLWWAPLLVSLGACIYLFNYAAAAQQETAAVHRRAAGYYQLLHNGNHPLIMLNPEGRIVEWNAAAEKMLGWAHAEVMGRKPDFLMPSGTSCKHDAEIKRRDDYDLAKAVHLVKCHIVCKNGEVLPVQLTTCAIKNGHGYYHLAIIFLQSEVDAVNAQKESDSEST